MKMIMVLHSDKTIGLVDKSNGPYEHWAYSKHQQERPENVEEQIVKIDEEHHETLFIVTTNYFLAFCGGQELMMSKEIFIVLQNK